MSEVAGVKVNRQMLRRWVASEMNRRDVDARYIDVFCGRMPSRVWRNTILSTPQTGPRNNRLGERCGEHVREHGM